MERDGIDHIRSATFPIGRRGYEKREVDRFLNELADWLETGGGDESRAEIVRRDLERVGQQTGKILADAHDAGEQLRAEAEGEAHRIADEVSKRASQTRAAADKYAAETRADADADAEKTRGEADDYASQTRTEADAYSATTREGADAYAAKVREEVDEAAAEIRARAKRDAEQTVAQAEGEARRIITEAGQRRSDIEAVISDLEARRDAALDDMQRISRELAGATQHRASGPDDQAPPESTSATERPADGPGTLT